MFCSPNKKNKKGFEVIRATNVEERKDCDINQQARKHSTSRCVVVRRAGERRATSVSQSHKAENVASRLMYICLIRENEIFRDFCAAPSAYVTQGSGLAKDSINFDGKHPKTVFILFNRFFSCFHAFLTSPNFPFCFSDGSGCSTAS